jgi:hypothetical protein
MPIFFRSPSTNSSHPNLDSPKRRVPSALRAGSSLQTSSSCIIRVNCRRSHRILLIFITITMSSSSQSVWSSLLYNVLRNSLLWIEP